NRAPGSFDTLPPPSSTLAQRSLAQPAPRAASERAPPLRFEYHRRERFVLLGLPRIPPRWLAPPQSRNRDRSATTRAAHPHPRSRSSVLPVGHTGSWGLRNTGYQRPRAAEASERAPRIVVAPVTRAIGRTP